MILKHRDTEVLRFDWVQPFGVKNVEVNSSAEHLLPLAFRDRMIGVDVHTLEWAVEDWLLQRRAPPRRRNIERMMALMGLDSRNPRVLLEYSKGLSLNDVYWVDFDDSKLLWSDCNLYANDFSKVIAEMAFTGNGRHIDLPNERSPEFTTNGALPKCWRRINGKIFLYKGKSDKQTWEVGRTDGFGMEPFSEYYASQLAAAMRLDHVPYGLDEYQGEICSTCPIFTSDRYGFIAAKDVPDRSRLLSDPRFSLQFFFDAVIFNTDRHWGNFGFLVDNDTNELLGPAPIFDNGYSLFAQARYLPGSPDDEFDDLRKFTSRKSPVLYEDWLSFPGGVTDEMIDRLQGLKGFRFVNDARYRLPEKRLEMIQYFIQSRIANIIKYRDNADKYIKISPADDTIKSKEKSPVSDLNTEIKGVLALCPTTSRKQLAEIFKLGPATIARHLKELQEAGELKRVGSRKTGYWEVLERKH